MNRIPASLALASLLTAWIPLAAMADSPDASFYTHAAEGGGTGGGGTGGGGGNVGGGGTAEGTQWHPLGSQLPSQELQAGPPLPKPMQVKPWALSPSAQLQNPGSVGLFQPKSVVESK